MKLRRKHDRSARGVPPKAIAGLIVVLSASLCMQGQSGSPITSLQPLAPGTSLPVQLTHELKAGAVKPGTTFVAKTTQRIPVAPHKYLRRGAEVLGEVIASDEGDAGSPRPSVLTLRFTELRYKGQRVPLSAKALAIANFVQVMDAAVIATGSTGTSSPASPPRAISKGVISRPT